MRNFAELLGADADVDAVQAEQGHDHVFHGHVAGAFAEAGDGGLRDGGAGLQRGQRIGDAEAEVLVAVDLQRLLQALDRFLDDVVDRVGSAAAHGVGQGEGVHVAFGGDSLDDVEEAIDFGARGVDGEEDRVQAGFLGGAGGVDGGLHGAIEGPAVGVLDHVVAGGNFDDHAGAAASLDDLDLFGDAAGEGEDFGLQAQRGDILNGRFVLLGDGGHAGFDAVNAEGIELLGDGHFFLAAEDDGGLLLAIAQGDIVDFDLGGEVIFLGDFGKIRPGADKPFVRFPGRLHLASVDCSRQIRSRQPPQPPNEPTSLQCRCSVGPALTGHARFVARAHWFRLDAGIIHEPLSAFKERGGAHGRLSITVVTRCRLYLLSPLRVTGEHIRNRMRSGCSKPLSRTRQNYCGPGRKMIF